MQIFSWSNAPPFQTKFQFIIEFKYIKKQKSKQADKIMEGAIVQLEEISTK